MVGVLFIPKKVTRVKANSYGWSVSNFGIPFVSLRSTESRIMQYRHKRYLLRSQCLYCPPIFGVDSALLDIVSMLRNTNFIITLQN